MRTIAFTDDQIAALNALQAGSCQPEHRAALAFALANCGWRDPGSVPPAFWSTPTNAVLVLVLHDGRHDHALGYFSFATGWRVLGEPPALHVRGWMPRPNGRLERMPWEE